MFNFSYDSNRDTSEYFPEVFCVMYGFIKYQRIARVASLLRKHLPRKLDWIISKTLFQVSTQAALMAALLTDFEPSPKRKRVETETQSSIISSQKGSASCSHDGTSNETQDQGKRENKTERKPDMQTKSRTNDLRGVKSKKIGTKFQLKPFNTLESWLVKPSKSKAPAEASQTQDDLKLLMGVVLKPLQLSLQKAKTLTYLPLIWMKKPKF
ncbi:hypothetical protein OJAV_G00191530 [Oryzias javanicus]|uniref:Uncharacterized protein n=1 Tax=Oryzias javanicus TaxID=123683 RepID=A0A3S2PSF3_ORYJA|nr:hypothetical protein OJAV_G00191530 [Oryzias javanicus]